MCAVRRWKDMAKARAADSATTAGAEARSRCDQGTEITPPLIVVSPGQRFDVHLMVCGAPALAVVRFGGEIKLQQRIDGEVAVPIAAPMFPSDTLLIWGLAPLASPWKAK